MFDLNQFKMLKDNNQLEIKEAKEGLADNIWETYSAFANTYGGTILLGIGEDENKNLFTCGLNEKEANNLIKTFWDTIHSDKVSINLLTDHHVKIKRINNDYIIEINIPQATRYDKPIYLNNNLYLCYRRNHEGDYKCSKAEVVNMVRDNDINSQDSYIVERLTIDDLCKETIEKYRMHFINNKGKEHPFSNEPLNLFLKHINAAKLDDNNVLRPTKAGLLMFGYSYNIVTVFPNFFLDHQDKRNIVGNMRWVNRIISSSGEWSGNLFDFYFRINNYLVENVKVPFKMNGIFRVDITPMHKAVREALCNCLSNADYNETRGVVIKQYNDKLEFSNPGAFTMLKKLAIAGGNSDARNKLILTMFNNINIGERTGSGIPLIINATEGEGYITPTFQDYFNPDYTMVTIYLKKDDNLEIKDNKLELKDDNLEIKNDKLELNDDKLEIKDNKLELKDDNLEIKNDKLELKDNNLEIKNDKLELKDDNLEIKDDKLELKDSSLKFYEQGLGITTVIFNLDIRSDLKSNLLTIYDKLQNSIFSNSSIVEEIKCSPSSADNYIKILKNNNLIEVVKGYGRGKYKFK